MKRKIVVTGAAGGMGRACTRRLGAGHELILTDAAAGPLALFADELRAEGYEVGAALPGDLASDALLAELAGHLDTDSPTTLIHTAGLSPSQAEWQPIMQVNLVATEKLLRKVEPLLASGSVGILIASAAGHLMPPQLLLSMPELAAALADPLAADLLERLAPHVEMLAAQQGGAGAGGVSYSLSKQAVIRLCEQRAVPWGQRGARIVSISPGMILTPMGRKELAETPGSQEMFAAAPAGRYGIPTDIAFAVEFLTSEKASFITGTDLRIDGGWIAAIRNDLGRTDPVGE